MSYKNIKAYAFDYPLVDLTIPQIRELKLWAEENKINEARLQEVLEQRQKIVDLIKDSCEPGDKITIEDKAKSELLVKMTLDLRDELLKDFGHDIAASGGTGANKLHTFKHVYEAASKAAGNNARVETLLVGSFGNDALAPLVEHYLEKSGTKTHPALSRTEASRATIVLTLDGEKDRRAIKSPFSVPAEGKNLELQKELSQDADIAFLEATLIDRLGPKNLVLFAEYLKNSGKTIVFSPPTDPKYLYDEKKGQIIKENVVSFVKVARLSNITAMNEMELQTFMGDFSPKTKIKTLHDEGFLTAIKKLRDNLKGIVYKDGVAQDPNPKFAMPDDHITVVTFGEHGAGAYKAHARKTAPSSEIPSDSVFYKIGAGDGYIAAFAALMLQAKNEENVNLSDNSLKFTNKADYSLRGAAKISKEIILRPEAQIDSKIITYTITKHKEDYKTPTAHLNGHHSTDRVTTTSSQLHV